MVFSKEPLHVLGVSWKEFGEEGITSGRFYSLIEIIEDIM